MDEIIYFDMPGRAAPLRAMYRFKGVEFKDTRIQRADWPTVQAKGLADGTLPYGQMPVVHIMPEDEYVAQSRSLYQIVGERLGLAPSTEAGRRKAMQFLDAVSEINGNAYQIMTQGDKLPAEMIERLKRVMKLVLDNTEKLIVGPYAVEDKPCYADFCISLTAGFLTMVPIFKEMAANYPKILHIGAELAK
eukprot:gnl/Dysnectes_brevis/1551_a1759_3722.p1 GENE.gnl/Dysnectes_brevis/1551_a1759_3722~~gnl/Dysnectes_brevis/1551_a1759_3722.p1  ORF type:complete len:191 (-),score=45.26 gnl/Dysnectes_brevis/1551_a1759_3722:78-650(-)